MTMRRWIPIGALAVLLAVAVVRFATGPSVPASGGSALPPGHPQTSGTGAVTASGGAMGTSLPSAGPSKDNVRHDVKARMAELEQTLAEAPGDTVSWAALARLQFDAHDMAGAARSYARYLALRERNRQAWLDLATAQASLSAWDEAREATERLLELYPDDVAGAYNMGAILANSGRPEEARTWWSRVAASGDAEMALRASQSLARLDS